MQQINWNWITNMSPRNDKCETEYIHEIKLKAP